MDVRPAALLVVVLVAGCLGAAGPAPDAAATPPSGERADLAVEWTSDTATGIGGNHHAVAAGRLDGRGVVLAPISGRGDSTECALYGLSATDGSPLWNRSIPPAACTLHSVGDPTLADFDADGTPEAIVATNERLVVAHHALTGREEFSHPLPTYGYTRPVVADLVGDADPELLVVDAAGDVFAFRPNGSTAWSVRLGAYNWGEPVVADLDGDGANEVAVGLEGGRIVALEGDGRRSWNRSPFKSSIHWQTAGQVDDDPGVEVVVATGRGRVAAIDGASGAILWERTLDRYASVQTVGDGDGDGHREVYAAANGSVYALRVADGTVEWQTRFTDADVTATPPPALGNLSRDRGPELLATADDGTVALLDPGSGAVLDTYHRSEAVFAHPTVADADGDGLAEGYVVYGDGVVVAFDGESASETASTP